MAAISFRGWRKIQRPSQRQAQKIIQTFRLKKLNKRLQVYLESLNLTATFAKYISIMALNTFTQDEGILYFDFKIPAGFPSPAADYMEERIDLNKELIKHPLSTFIVECEGDSMINAFIPHRARLIVDRSLTAKNGSVVVAVLNGEFTVKYFKKNERKCWLVPANRKFKEIEITPEMEMQVWGVVTTIIILPGDTTCML